MSTIELNKANPVSSSFSVHFSSINLDNPPKIYNDHEECCSVSDHSDFSEEVDEENIRQVDIKDDVLVQNVKIIVNILNQMRGNPVEIKNKIEQCGVGVTEELVIEVLSRMRNNWEAAFFFFTWAGNQSCYSPSVREYHSMISILAKMRKFDTAWKLIEEEMRGVKTCMPLVSWKTLLIMIRRYCAVHDVAKAIHAFYQYKQYKFDVGINEFQGLLSALCRYNGWCNAIGSPREAERVWREMCKRRINYDVVSYSSIITCYSKSGNLYKVLKLYEQMKEMGIEPDRKVFNAVIFALAKGRHVNDAIHLLKTMEEKGITPNTVTYNSLIKPLCKARKMDEARGVFDAMIERGHSPSIQTYHAFFRGLRTTKEVFALLENMRKMGCEPIIDTYIMLIRKFCRWRQFDDVFKLWNEMAENGAGPDRSSYIVLIHGLFLNGKLEEAYKYYADMKEKEFLPDPKIDEMLQNWFSSKQIAGYQMMVPKGNQFDASQSGKQTRTAYRGVMYENKISQQAESRRVVREQGYSIRDQ